MSNNNSNNVGIEWEIEVAFSRLIGPLAIMAELKSYKISYKEIHTLIHIIAGLGARFQNDRNLFFIEPDELLDVYYRLDALKDKHLCDPNIGNESELSDEVVIWMYELMVLRKKQIEKRVKVKTVYH